MCRTKNIKDNVMSSSKNVKNVTNETLTNISPFLIKKVIDGICGSEVEMCKKICDDLIPIKTKQLNSLP